MVESRPASLAFQDRPGVSVRPASAQPMFQPEESLRSNRPSIASKKAQQVLTWIVARRAFVHVKITLRGGAIHTRFSFAHIGRLLRIGLITRASKGSRCSRMDT